jgi:hypothetical protein
LFCAEADMAPKTSSNPKSHRQIVLFLFIYL